MTQELLVQNKRTGQVWDIANMVESVELTTERTGAPATLKFNIVAARGGLSFLEGDTVRFSVDGQLQFFGWVFTKVKNRWYDIECTCYDRLRYLKANASYSFYDMTVGDMIAQIAGDLEVGLGEIADTGYKIPSFIKEDASCLDIIGEAVQQTLLNTGKIYVFYDDGDGLALKEAAAMTVPVMVGDGSYLLDYEYKTDIDEMTYNSIKLARPNAETGRADVVEAKSNTNIAQWGLLQLYQIVDESLNTAQMEAQARASLEYYNRRMRTISAESLGVPGVRAGNMLLMQVRNLGDVNLNQYVLLERVTHTYENQAHTMSFDTMSI